MADISDVQDQLAAICGAALYPNGTSSPSAIGVDALIYPGWPQPSQLDKDMVAGRVHVSIWARGDGTNTTRYPSVWQETVAPVQTLTLVADANTVTIGGTVSTPQVVVVNGMAYAVQANDTLSSIAAALATHLPGASSAGPVLTVPTGVRQSAVAATGTIARETRRQTDTVQLSVWAPTPALRSAAAKALDAVFADLRFIEMPDHSSCRLKYIRSLSSDLRENALIYRRDLFYQVEFATTVTAVATQVATPIVNVQVDT
jgi:hypothetical protein